jgi:hypothetical protein
MPKLIRRSLAAAALAALAATALALPPAARADDAVPPEEGPKTVVKYLACAGGLALASDLSTAFAAAMYCAKTFLDEFHP